jgi:hypothetical protein
VRTITQVAMRVQQSEVHNSLACAAGSDPEVATKR